MQNKGERIIEEPIELGAGKFGRLLAAGNWIVDHVKLIDRWPEQETLASITAQSDGNGGGPYNVTKNLAQLGCGFPLAGLGLIGRDADGEGIDRDCDAHGIDRRALRKIGGAPTSYTNVMTVAGTGRRTFFHCHGANARLDSEHFDFSGRPAGLFYLGYLGLLERLDALGTDGRTAASHILEQASALGWLTAADLVSTGTPEFPAIVNPSLPHLDFLFLNEYELARLVGGQAGASPAALQMQAREVLQRGVRQAVIVHLPEGAMCVPRQEPAVMQASVCVPPEMIVGTAGAGDALAAGFLLGLHRHWQYQQCLQLGVCCAAASLRDATCSAAVEPWQDCLALGHKWGFNRKFSLK